MTVIDAIKADAATRLAQYPQYDGYHDGPEWTLVTVRRNVKTKLGQAFVKGQVALAKHSPAEYMNGHLVVSEGWTVWSTSNRCHTFLPLNWAQVA
jgi:hypothetical protein